MARFKLGEVKVKDLIERRLEVEIHLPITTLKYIPLIIEHANPEDNLCSVLCGIKKRSQAWKNEKEPKKETILTIYNIQKQSETKKEEIRKDIGLGRDTWELMLTYAPPNAKLKKLLKNIKAHRVEWENKKKKDNKPKIDKIFPKSYSRIYKHKKPDKELIKNLENLCDLRHKFCGVGTRKIKKILRERGKLDQFFQAYYITLLIIESNLQAKIYRDIPYLKEKYYNMKTALIEKLMAECRINGWGYGFNYDFDRKAKMISFQIPGFKEFVCFHLWDERYLFATPIAKRIKKKKTNFEVLEVAIKSRLRKC